MRSIPDFRSTVALVAFEPEQCTEARVVGVPGFVRHPADRIVPGSEVVSSAQMLPRQYAHLRSIPESTLSLEVGVHTTWGGG